MTAATRSAGPAATAAPRPALALEETAEIVFAFVSLAAVVSLRRVFDGTEWLPPLLLQIVAAHLTVAALRRRRASPAAAAVVGVVLAGLCISWIYAGEFTTFGIPTGDTVRALVDSVRTAMSTFNDVKAPVEPARGFLVLTAEAVWLTAIIGDWAAFRMRAAFEALLPSATVFGIGAVLGADIDRVAFTGVWIGSVLVFLLVRRADRLSAESTWVGDERGRGPRTMVLLGTGLTAVATVIAAIVGPNLPGAGSEAILNLTDIGDGPGTRVTISPLVDIRSRLVDQSDVEVFTVRSDVRSYWRLTSLDRFDGRIWSSNGSYGRSAGPLDEGQPVASDRITVTQHFEIAALAQIWLPAAYEPRQVDVVDPIRYDEVSGTLIVDTDVPTADGATYGVISALPVHDPIRLATASRLVPQAILDQYLVLPEAFSPAVRQLARDLTAPATSAYDAALRLQNFFRDNFSYDLTVGPGHGDDAIESFVFDLRRGYCEQFAGTYAAMARSIGIPARVAVGFTPGVTDPADPTLFHVRGEHAHAWPEVFLGEYGWVAFEPTPGRGAPFAEQYTGVPEQQVVSGGDPTTATTAPSPPSTIAVSPTSVPGDLATPVLDDPGADQDVDTSGENGSSPWLGRLATAAGALVVTIALYLVAVAAATAWRRMRRRRLAVSPTARIALAWEESLRSVGRLGVPTRDAETQSQTAARISHALPTAAGALVTLAAVVETAGYAPEPPGDEDADRAGALADEIDDAVRQRQSDSERFRQSFHPRRLHSD